jgi:hypothetical protein
MSQMVQNGEGKCTRRTLSGIEEKIISEDEMSYSKVIRSSQVFLCVFMASSLYIILSEFV